MKQFTKAEADLRDLGRHYLEAAKTQLLNEATLKPTITLINAMDGSDDVTIAFDETLPNSATAKQELTRKVWDLIAVHRFSLAICVADACVLDDPKDDPETVASLIQAGYSLPAIGEIFRMCKPREQVIVMVQTLKENIVIRHGYCRAPDGTVEGFHCMVEYAVYRMPRWLAFSASEP